VTFTTRKTGGLYFFRLFFNKLLVTKKNMSNQNHVHRKTKKKPFLLHRINSIRQNEMAHQQLNGHPFCSSGAARRTKNCANVNSPTNTTGLHFSVFVRFPSVFFLFFRSFYSQHHLVTARIS